MPSFWDSGGLVILVGLTMAFLTFSTIYVFSRLSVSISTLQWKYWRKFMLALAVLLITVVCFELLHSKHSTEFVFALIPFWIPYFYLPSSDSSRTQKPTMLAFFCIGFTLIMQAISIFPNHTQLLVKIVHHVGFVIPLWVFFLWQLSKLWKKENPI